VACALAEGLVRCGQAEEARVELEEVRTYAEEVRGAFWLPDLLRVRGEILLACPRPDLAGAEHALRSSIEAAQKQSAQSWELRAAIPLARMWLEQGRSGQARTLLEQIYGRFTEGFATLDLIKARKLLAELGCASCLSMK
jgi:predicted ATPase